MQDFLISLAKHLFIHFRNEFPFYVFNIKKVNYTICLHSGFHGHEEELNQHWLEQSTVLGFDGFSLQT